MGLGQALYFQAFILDTVTLDLTSARKSDNVELEGSRPEAFVTEVTARIFWPALLMGLYKSMFSTLELMITINRHIGHHPRGQTIA